MSECTSCSDLVAQEVVGVNGFRANCHFMQLSQSHFPIIFRAAVIVGNISKAFGPTCARQRCNIIRISASCQDKWPVVFIATRHLSLISEYSVGSRFRTRSTMKC
jgi:hypothetical protein